MKSSYNLFKGHSVTIWSSKQIKVQDENTRMIHFDPSPQAKIMTVDVSELEGRRTLQTSLMQIYHTEPLILQFDEEPASMLKAFDVSGRRRNLRDQYEDVGKWMLQRAVAYQAYKAFLQDRTIYFMFGASRDQKVPFSILSLNKVIALKDEDCSEDAIINEFAEMIAYLIKKNDNDYDFLICDDLVIEPIIKDYPDIRKEGGRT